MTKARMMIVLLFVVAFAAGGASTLAFRQWERPGGHGPSWLTSELDLSAQQQQEMIKIWGSSDRSGMQEESERRHEFQRQRDESIRALVPAEKRAELDKVQEAYAQQMADLGEQRRRRFDASVEKTKAILTPEQRKKYDQILARGQEGRHFHGMGPGGFPGSGPGGPPGSDHHGPRPELGPPDTHPSTRPSKLPPPA